MKKYAFELTGTTALLMSNDSIEGADDLEAWRKDPGNKNVSKPGDDRSPGWTWTTRCYNDGEYVAMPSDNVMAALRTAGAKLILKKQKTFKEVTQSGMLIHSEFCQLYTGDGKQVSWAAIEKNKEKPFAKQADACRDLGFRLFLKRARIGTSKHIRVRPRFDAWQVKGNIEVTVPELTPEIVAQLFGLAGKAGLGDWRPSAKSPGPFGMFTAKVKAI